MSGVAGVILAAGRGTRFADGFKLLAELDGKPLLRRVAEAALASRLAPVVAVTGHRAAEVEAALAGLPLDIVPNPRFADGLSTSLQAGFAAVAGKSVGVLVLLGDMPEVSARLTDDMVERWTTAGRPAAAVPVYEGRRGNPVLLSVTLAPEIRDLQGDTGAGPLLRGRPDVLEIPVADQAVVQDVDTPAMLDRLRRRPR